ncbi:MAG: hypothetical protein U0Z44_02960 [Kouleothrix sp.]
MQRCNRAQRAGSARAHMVGVDLSPNTTLPGGAFSIPPTLATDSANATEAPPCK